MINEIKGVAIATACAECPSLQTLMERYESAGGRYLVCPICVNSNPSTFIRGAEMGGTVQLWEWIGDGATAFSY